MQAKPVQNSSWKNPLVGVMKLNFDESYTKCVLKIFMIYILGCLVLRGHVSKAYAKFFLDIEQIGLRSCYCKNSLNSGHFCSKSKCLIVVDAIISCLFPRATCHALYLYHQSLI